MIDTGREEVRGEGRTNQGEDRWGKTRQKQWELPNQRGTTDKNKTRKNTTKQGTLTSKGIYRRRFGATRGNYVSYKQTFLRPQCVTQGGDFYYNDIRKPPTKAYRVYFQNLGGYPLDYTRQIADLSEVHTFKADFIGLQETKLNEMHKGVITKTADLFRKHLDAATYFKSNNDSFSESYWKPGGLASLTMRHFKKKDNKNWTDPTALIQRTRITTGTEKLGIFNIYLPKFNPGATSTYTQALNTIRKLEEWGTVVSIEDYFYKTLSKCVQEDVRNGYTPIVGGDFNDTQSEKSNMTTNMTAMGMINVTSPPDTCTPATYKRGKRTLDHIWIAPGLVPLTAGYGYIPYDYGFTADHRGMFVDIQTTSRELIRLPKKRRRKLNSKNPVSVERYTTALWKRVKGQNIEARLAGLEGKTILTQAEREELDKIDQMMTSIMLASESELQPCRSFDYSSDKMTEAKRTRHYWRKILHLSHTDSHFSLRKYFPLHREDNVGMSRKDIKDKIMEASLKVIKIRKEGYATREDMLNERARHETRRQGTPETGNTSIKALLNAEKSKRKYAKLRQYKHPKSHATKNLEIPAETRDVDTMWKILKEERREIDDIQWEQVHGKDETADFLIRWCIRHFGQATETPLYKEQWRNSLDPKLATNIIQEIIKGRMKVPDGCPPEFEQFMRAARTPQGITEVTFKMTFAHFKTFCRKQDERKGSSPSGLHYGHIKALTFDERLLRIKYKIIELAYTNRVILTRWKSLWEVLIPKKSRSYIHKFRNITLVEGDIQYVMKAIWSGALMKAVSSNLHPSQNALQGRVTQSGVLSHRIALDTLFVRGEECIVFENDAVNCFDRILPHIAALAFMRLGMSLGMVLFFMDFLESAEHHIILGNNPSEERYAHSENTPIMGSGQGTGWAGPSWFAVADIIFTSLEENQPGLYLISPDGRTTDFRTAEASVDDARQGINTEGVIKFNTEHETTLTLIQAASKASQSFERYLTLTGGKLALDKTMFYALIPDMGKTQKRYLGKEEIDIEIELDENFNGEPVKLNMYQPNEAHKMLGIYTDPAGTLIEQIEYMCSQSREWNTRMLGSTLSSEEKWLSYRTELCPRLLYPIPALALTIHDCNRIIKPALPSIKHGLGLAKTSPTEVIYFPREYGGYGTIDLHLEKVAEQSKYIVQHLRNGDSLGRRIIISIETTQLESGLNDPVSGGGILNRINYITPTILTELIRDLWELRAEIRLEHWTPGQGMSIMEIARAEARDDEQIAEINLCRLWLKVHYLSDVATLDGVKIHPGYKKGSRVRDSKWNWPRWRPPKASWKVWCTALRSYIDNKLPRPRVHEGHQKEHAWTDAKNRGVSTEDGDFVIVQRGRRKALIEGNSESHKYIPCDVYDHGEGLELIARAQPWKGTPDPHDAPNSFLEGLKSREPSLAEIFQELPYAEEDHRAIAELMRDGKLVAGCDGGDNQNGRIVFNMTLASEDLLDIHSSSHEILGGPKDSGRAETMGIMITVIYLCHVIEWYGLTRETKVMIYCDNREAVDFSNHLWMGTTPRWADGRNIELKRTISAYLRSSGRGLCISHVKGHQDKKGPASELDIPAKINIICDKGCQAKLDTEPQIGKESRPRGPMTEDVACLMVDGVPITTGYHRSLYKKRYASKVATHIGLTTEEFDRIDWEGHERAMKATGGPSMRRLVWGHHPTRTHLKVTGQYPTSICPLCGEQDARDHYMRCITINLSRQYKQLRDEKRHLASKYGFPDLMVNTVAKLMEGETIREEQIPSHAREVYRDQETIGWRNMTVGRISLRWSELKTTDYRGRLETDRRWRTRAIKTILGWTHDKWLLRCQLFQDPGMDHEHQALYKECKRWWETKMKRGLHKTDAHLRNYRQEPRMVHSKDYMREWLRTREIAETAYARYAPRETQPTLHRWLVHK